MDGWDRKFEEGNEGWRREIIGIGWGVYQWWSACYYAFSDNHRREAYWELIHRQKELKPSESTWWQLISFDLGFRSDPLQSERCLMGEQPEGSGEINKISNLLNKRERERERERESGLSERKRWEYGVKDGDKNCNVTSPIIILSEARDVSVDRVVIINNYVQMELFNAWNQVIWIPFEESMSTYYYSHIYLLTWIY